jgi:hypothetical protein
MSRTKNDNKEEYLKYAVDDADLEKDEGTQQLDHEASMSSSMSLDMDAVRRRREELTSRTQKPTADVTSRGPKTELGKAIDNVLFNPDYPHPHNVHFKEEIEALIRRVEHMGVGERLAGGSSFFPRHRYVFQSNNEKPVIVMKSLEELEREQEENKNKICSGYNSELIQAIEDAFKRSKKSKKKNRVESSQISAKPVAADDDLDMFGGFVGSSQPSQRVEKVGRIFEPRGEDYMHEPDAAKLIREKLIESRLPKERDTERVDQVDDEFFKTSQFGQKLDVSKFQQTETEDDSSKKRKSKDNAIFQKVMKKLDNR